MAIKIGLIGSTGKVGQEILKITRNDDAYIIVGEFSSKSNIKNLDAMFANADVLIDFSIPNDELLSKLLSLHKPLVIGTTGFNAKQIETIQYASRYTPILFSPNMSLGANLLAMLSKIMQKYLPSYDIKIIDLHHRDKKDAPSGTALMIAQNINSEVNPEILSIRAGKVFGEHSVMYAGDDEVITLTHQALNRKVFASRALEVAKWLIKQKPELYSMKEFMHDLNKY
jgi:4-hydroxy-tetrahydrodipicolinate reductase